MRLFGWFHVALKGLPHFHMTSIKNARRWHCHSWNIAQAKKPYNEGDIVKKCLSDAVEILSPEDDKLKRMVSDVQLSRHTVERRISDINTAIVALCSNTVKNVALSL